MNEWKKVLGRPCVLLASVVVWLVSPRLSAASEVFDCVLKQHTPAHAEATGLPNPAKHGNYGYTFTSYGESPSFFTITRPDIVAPNVELPDFLAEYSRNQGYERDAYHHFDGSDVPLNAKVWLTKHAQPRPLVLLVHGNSNPGFEYLATLLASRGHNVVQIDQTYLNGMWGENGARGWLILEHLKLLKTWNAQTGHSFHQKLDLDKIALIGMSRGGEAVALAATFNQWKTLPSSDKPTGFGFNIRSVVALAPMDGQYHHAAGRNALKNVNYLVLQGGHDADVYQFLGSQQWHRTLFDSESDYIKHAIYIYRANHINFNQSMSDDFLWGSRKAFYAKLLSPEQQETLTKVFVSAFLEATLASNQAYQRILKRPPIGEFDLPDDIYITRYLPSGLSVIENFEGAEQPEEGTTFGISPVTTAATVEFERLREGTKTTNRALKLALKAHTETRLSFALSDEVLSGLSQKNGSVLTFSLARVDGESAPNCDSYNVLNDAIVQLNDKSGTVFSATLSEVGSLAPLLTSDYSELEGSDVRFAPTEPLLQTFTLPIGSANSDAVKGDMELVFKFTPKRDLTLMLDDIGITSK